MLYKIQTVAFKNALLSLWRSRETFQWTRNSGYSKVIETIIIETGNKLGIYVYV